MSSPLFQLQIRIILSSSFFLLFYISADDMGLGKTLTMISLILAKKNKEKEEEKKEEKKLEKWISKTGHVLSSIQFIRCSLIPSRPCECSF